MEQRNQTKKVTISKKVLDLIELMGEEKRNELAGKAALKINLLKDDKEEKLATFKEEVKSAINRMVEVVNGPLLFELLAIFDDDDYGFWTDSHLFKMNVIEYGLKVKLNEEIQYIKSISKIEVLVNSMENGKELNKLSYEELDSIRSEIIDLPGIKPLIEVLIYLKHLDLLDSYLYHLKNNRPILSNISDDNENRKTIETYFDELHSNLRGKKLSFYHENDYKYFVDILTLYFEGNNYPKIDNKIKLIPSIKGVFLSTLGKIHDYFKGTKNPDDDFCDVVRNLQPFEKDSYGRIYKGMRNKD